MNYFIEKCQYYANFENLIKASFSRNAVIVQMSTYGIISIPAAVTSL